MMHALKKKQGENILMLKRALALFLLSVAFVFFSSLFAEASPGQNHDSLYVQRAGDNTTGTFGFMGNIGVGTKSPSDILNVNGTFRVDNTSGNVLFFVNTTRSGGVGVGTTTPATQLDVEGKLSFLSNVSLNNSASNFNIYLEGSYAYVAANSVNQLIVIDISNPASPVLVSKTGTDIGPAGIFVQGKYAYVTHSTSNTLLSFDISNPASPVLVGNVTVETAGTAYNLYVQGKYAYVASFGNSTLTIIDVSNPRQPVRISNTRVTQPWQTYIQGPYAYVATLNPASLNIYDVRDPASPVLVGNTSSGLSSARYVSVQGSYAYVTSQGNDNLVIFNISNSSNPTKIGNITGGASNPYGINIQGRYAYVGNVGTPSISSYDISNPSKPLLMSTIALPDIAHAIAIQGRYAYTVATGLFIIDLGGAYVQQLETGGIETGMLNTRSNAEIGNDLNVVGGLSVGSSALITGGLSVFSPLTNVSFVVNGNGSVGIGTTMPNERLQVNGNVRVDNNAGTGILYVNSTSSTVGIGGTAASYVLQVNGNVSLNNTLYVSNSNVGIGAANPTDTLSVTGNFRVDNASGNTTFYVNTTSPGGVGIGTTAPVAPLHIAGSPPRFISSITLVGRGASINPSDIYVQGKYAYIVDTSFGNFFVYDISDPFNPARVANRSLGVISIGGISVQGKYAYTTDEFGSVKTIDISNPSNPRKVGTDNAGSGGFSTSIAVQGRYAYEADDNLGLNIHDLSNSSNPLTITSVDLPGGQTSTMFSVATQGKYVYVAATTPNMLSIFDVSNPLSPVLMNNVSIANIASVTVQGRYAYAGTSSNLIIVDVNNVSSPTVISNVSVSAGTNPRQVVVQGRYAYVVGANFSVVDISNASAPAVVFSTNMSPINPAALFVQGRYAYIVDPTLHKLDIFDLGGAYVQQLEAGGIETGTLNTQGNVQVGTDLSVRGGVRIGGSTEITGAFSVNPLNSSGIFTITQNGSVGIGDSNPAYPLVVRGNTTGISIWAETNVSAAGYITRTEVFKGDALDQIHDASYYLNPDGTVDHKKFGESYAQYHTNTVALENRTLTIACGKKKNKNCKDTTRIEQVPVPLNKTEEGVDLGKELSLVKQAVFELKSRVGNETLPHDQERGTNVTIITLGTADQRVDAPTQLMLNESNASFVNASPGANPSTSQPQIIIEHNNIVFRLA